MANVTLILGKSGTGKSSSARNMNPDELVIFNVLKKRLPFKGSQKMFNTQKMNLFNIDDYQTICNYLKDIDKKATKVKNVIIDDFTYVMRKEYYKSAKVTGYSKYVDMAAHFQSIIQTAENMRDDLNVFLMMHCDEVLSDKTIVGYKPSTIGKMIDDSYNPTEVVPIVLFSAVKYDEGKNPIYGFYTNRCLEGAIEIPAKSPDGMFNDIFIPNDLTLVVNAMTEYYG